jgi:hypothetical protein
MQEALHFYRKFSVMPIKRRVKLVEYHKLREIQVSKGLESFCLKTIRKIAI